jgi:hypothetical protein
MHPDFLDMFRVLIAHGVRFIVVGGYAVAHAGFVRSTKDIDLWVEPCEDNARRLIRALLEYGAPINAHGVNAKTFMEEGEGYQIGVAPVRIDLLTFCAGIAFERSFERAERVCYGDIEGVPVLHLLDLKASKLALGRPQDLADVARLDALHSS